MAEFAHSMALPFAACLLLTGIHVYLGIHVISRKVIFVDLALAQIAALGSVWGVLLGWDLATDPWHVKAFSLAFTFVGAALFSLTRMKDERVPHEAIIGIVYAVALAATILASAHLAHGAEEVGQLLAGSILWVRGPLIAATAGLYAAVGLFHWIFRRQFLAISLDPAGAEARGLNVRLWDFLFYVSFGFVVTSSVSIAGVLLVFSYLVIPSVIGVLFAERIGARLAVGWTVGTLVSLAGSSISYFRDLPSGPTIVVCFGAALVLAGIVHSVLRSPRPLVAAARAAGVVAAAALFFAGTLPFKKKDDHDLRHFLLDGTKAEQLIALQEIAAEPAKLGELDDAVRAVLASGPTEVRTRILEMVSKDGLEAYLPAVQGLLSEPDDLLRDAALRCLRDLHDPASADAIAAAAKDEPDEYLRTEMAEALLELGDRRGAPILLDVIAAGDAAQARRDAYEHLRAHLPIDLPFDPRAPADELAGQVAAIQAWWAEHGSGLEGSSDGTFR